ncbi:nucleolar protein 7 [Pitangus sulphuratus]|nr:nucleolar protein 7 [Pitangus sulphuratus]
MAMARRKKAKAAAAGKRRAPAALPSPASSSEDEADEAPEQVSFGAAREAAKAERKLVGEAARRLAEQAPADDQGEELEDEAEKQEQGPAQGQGQAKMQVKKGKARKGARSKGNYAAVCLKDQSSTGLHQQLARDFLNAQLYGPHTNRVQANEFFSLANKKDPVKKAAVQFVDKSWEVLGEATKRQGQGSVVEQQVLAPDPVELPP